MTDTLALLANGRQQFIDANGNPLVGGTVATYTPGTLVPKTTYQDSSGVSANPNPLTLDALGSAAMWGNGYYRQIVKDVLGNVIWDQVTLAPPVGATGNAVFFDTLATAAASQIDVSVNVVYLNGYYAAGDGGGGLYRRQVSAPAHQLYFRSVDGAYWELITNPVDVKQAGAKPDGATDASTAINNAISYAFIKGVSVNISGGTFLCLSDISVSTGDGSPDIVGDGWSGGSVLKFSGASCTHGLYFNGNSSTYPKAGTVRNIKISCVGGAVRCITLFGVNHPRLERVWIDGANGNGVFANFTLLLKMEHCLITNCGTASLSPVEIDNSTVFNWYESRISGANSGVVAGLLIDRTSSVSIISGAIESTGTPIRICSKTEATINTTNVRIADIDLERPGDHYIDAGYGWTGATFQGVVGMVLDNVLGTPSGATQVLYGCKLNHTSGFEARQTKLGIVGAFVCSFWFESTNNFDAVIRSNGAAYDANQPWVFENSVQRIDATTFVDWFNKNPKSVAATLQISGTAPSAQMSVHGGIAGTLPLINGAPVTMTSLTGGTTNIEVTILGDGQCTVQNNGAAGGFLTNTGADMLLAANLPYRFICNGVGTWIMY